MEIEREKIEELLTSWRAVANKHRSRATEAWNLGDMERYGFSAGMAERSDYCADELELLIRP